jgi:hypothetical protein
LNPREMRSCCALFLSFTQYSYRRGEAPAEFTAPLHFPTVLSTTCTSIRCIAEWPDVALRSARSCEGTHTSSEFGKGRRWQQRRGRSRGPRGASGGEKRGGGGLINSGWRVFRPNVLGRYSRTPLGLRRKNTPEKQKDGHKATGPGEAGPACF